MNKKILVVLILGIFMIGLGSAALIDDIQSYYKLDETSGSVIDSEGSNTGTNNGATPNVTGKINTAYDFDGSNDYISLLDGSDTIKDSTEGSVSLWINTDTISAQKVVLGSGNSGSSGVPYFFLGIDNQELYISGNNGTNNVERTGSVITSTGTWYHVVFTNSGSTNKIYLNGVDQGALTLVTGSAGKWFGDIPSKNTLAIGVVDRSVDFAPWDGKIDEVGIWTGRALSQSEVTELYNSGIGNSYPFTNGSNIHVDLVSPENNSKQISPIINFTAKVIVDEGFNHTNQTLYIWNDNGSLFYNNTLTENYNLAIALEWNTSGFALGVDYTWNVLACRNDSLCNFATNNFTFTSSAFSESTVNFKNSVLETSRQQFNLTISSTGVSEVSSTLWYNGTSYPAIIINLENGNYKAIRSIDIPLQNNIGNKSFHWQFDFILVNSASLQQNSTIYSQEVNRTFFTLCNATYDVPFVNFTSRDAENPFPKIDISFKSAWKWYVEGGTGSVFRNMSYEDVTETKSDFDFCGSPNVTFLNWVDVEVDSDGFAQNYYFLINSSLSNDTSEIELYLLNDSLATPTTLAVKDKFQNPIESMLIHIQLFDVGTATFYTVGMARTNNNGQDNAYLNWYDSLYKFILIQDGTTVMTTNITKVFETPTTFEIPDTTTYSFDKFQDFEFSLTYNEILKLFSLTYVKPSGEVEQGCLRVIKRNSTADTEICLTCSESASATIFCDISSAGNGTFIAAFYATGSWFMIDWFEKVIGESFAQGINDLLDQDDAAFYAIILIGFVLSMFLFSPILGIIGALLGLLAAGALGFTVLSYSLYLGIVIIGGVIIWILKK